MRYTGGARKRIPRDDDQVYAGIVKLTRSQNPARTTRRIEQANCRPRRWRGRRGRWPRRAQREGERVGKRVLEPAGKAQTATASHEPPDSSESAIRMRMISTSEPRSLGRWRAERSLRGSGRPLVLGAAVAAQSPQVPHPHIGASLPSRRGRGRSARRAFIASRSFMISTCRVRESCITFVHHVVDDAAVAYKPHAQRASPATLTETACRTSTSHFGEFGGGRFATSRSRPGVALADR